MATRRRIGVSNATTEAARRQLMQPVVCWEKVWSTPQNVPAGSSLKIKTWVKTDKVPHFEDENEVDEPLAPLPDEPEVVEVEVEEEEESTQPVAEEKMTVEPPEAAQEAEESKPPSPKPQLTMSTEDTMEVTVDAGDVLDASLKPMDTSGLGEEDISAVTDVGMDIDLSGLGPDGLVLESGHDLSQIEEGDNLMGGPTMNNFTVDPFAVDPIETTDEN